MKRFSFCIILILLIIAASDVPHAKVKGVCSNCHTMHNSQGGAPMARGDQAWGGTGGATDARPNLLVASCLGCHSSTGADTIVTYNGIDFPIVYNTGGYPTNPLAGGNFYWVKTDDTRGHNVFSDYPEETLNPVKAPGDSFGFSTCGTESCHKNIHGTVSGAPGSPELNGRQGCTKCHMMGKSVNSSGKPSGYHHADDTDATPADGWRYVDSAAKGWYRFLSGHSTGDGLGVAGIEHEEWNHSATVGGTNHNEYSGVEWPGGYGFGCFGSVMTAYCTGCHGAFHSGQGGTSSPFLRHPSDIVIKNSGEYASAFGAVSGVGTYDPELPVARPGGFTWAGGPSNTVSLDTDMVMCLSCHVAHGSPYYKMLRWDYKNWPGSGTDGCGKCHTSKN